MNEMKSLALAFMLVCAGCASTKPPPTSTDPAYEAALVASRSQRAEDVKKYMETGAISIVREQQLLTKNDCSRGGAGYHIILRLEAGGSVDQLVGREENRITECFRETFRDVRFQAPPFAPFYLEFCRGECPGRI
jgi:hypothetical protein